MATRFSYRPVFDFHNNEETDDESEFITDSLPFVFYDVKTEPSDATTQTELKKKMILNDPILNQLGTNNEICAGYNIESLNSPIKRKKTNGGRKERSPRTLLKLMERHRHNERVRHHTLNERLRVICQFVPGSGEDGRETKVVMMQRIISYIAYLENTIAHLRTQLGLHSDPSLAPLTFQLRNQIEEFASMAVVPDLDDASTSKKPKTNQTSTPRRYKISSPTVDSTTDRMVPNFKRYQNSQESSQDSMAPSSTFYPYSMATDNSLSPWLVDEPMVHCNGDDFETFFDPSIDENQSAYFQPISDSSYMTEPSNLQIYNSQSYNSSIQDSFTIISSPSSSKQSIAFSPDDSQDILGDSMNDEFGLKNNGGSDFLHTIAVSPDTILPIRQQSEVVTYQEVTSDYPSIIADNVEIETYRSPMVTSSVWSPQHKNKRKQYTPTKREPLQTLTANSSPFSIEDSNEAVIVSETTPTPHNVCKDCPEIVQPIPCTWTIHTVNNESSNIKCHKYEIIKQTKIDQPAPSKENKGVKIDHRKTSWMNGFMMYSRLNRRQFINANPGVHTSNISKMMGHSWRAMSSESQQPYKDKAKIFLREMQRIQDLSTQEEITTGSSNALRSSTSNENNLHQIPVIQIGHTSSSASSTKSISTSTHPIYNSQRWMYL